MSPGPLNIGARSFGAILFVAFASTIPLSNWLISNVGTTCVPDGPCLIPVAPGILAPSGVLTIGAALVLRDLIHRYLGANWAIAAILVGGCVSLLTASQNLVIASVAAFMISEMLDFTVYVPLSRRNLSLAILVSGVVAAIADSVVFVLLAFGSLDHVTGQIIGKLWASIIVAMIVFAGTRRRAISRTDIGA
ncbi:VUT family protein [Neogemmobacter tilapiae]|uniref:VUT family protein n=1 Tax=Neogemmobacter tilapiae TaxID=875041 RepID=A0A918TJW0_9RHOB|nr:VUT family protein [Gemmobacter tilapiae]GHC52387.1 hypothetical protein GCM10007315_13580 [Gemmobacter tilapiae]